MLPQVNYITMDGAAFNRSAMKLALEMGCAPGCQYSIVNPLNPSEVIVFISDIKVG